MREGAIPEAEVARRAEKGRGTLSVAAKVLCWPPLVQHGKCDLVEQGIALFVCRKVGDGGVRNILQGLVG